MIVLIREGVVERAGEEVGEGERARERERERRGERAEESTGSPHRRHCSYYRGSLAVPCLFTVHCGEASSSRDAGTVKVKQTGTMSGRHTCTCTCATYTLSSRHKGVNRVNQYQCTPLFPEKEYQVSESLSFNFVSLYAPRFKPCTCICPASPSPLRCRYLGLSDSPCSPQEMYLLWINQGRSAKATSRI